MAKPAATTSVAANYFRSEPGNADLHFAQATAFGAPGSTFVAGIWRIERISDDFYFWVDNGAKAMQITVDSNGWWGLRSSSNEHVVKSDGGFMTRTDTQFYQRPWQGYAKATFPIANVKYQLRGRHGPTLFDISNDQIRIRLPDNGEIAIDTRQPAIVFKTKYGRTFDF
jgi:hypothetical protein